MPQLNIVTFFSQTIWLVVFFCSYYWIVYFYFLLPVVYVFKTRMAIFLHFFFCKKIGFSKVSLGQLQLVKSTLINVLVFFKKGEENNWVYFIFDNALADVHGNIFRLFVGSCVVHFVAKTFFEYEIWHFELK